MGATGVPGSKLGLRLRRMRQQGWKKPVELERSEPLERNVALDCGWGRLLFAQTFESPEALIDALGAEGPYRRDIAFYVREPHVLLAHAPQEVFLDPSHTYRLNLPTYRSRHRNARGFLIRRLTSPADAVAINPVGRVWGTAWGIAPSEIHRITPRRTHSSRIASASDGHR